MFLRMISFPQPQHNSCLEVLLGPALPLVTTSGVTREVSLEASAELEPANDHQGFRRN